MEIRRGTNTPLLGSVVVVIILAAAFGFYYYTSSQRESAMNSTISSLSSVVGAQSSSIQSQSANIQSESASISTLSASISSLKGSVSTLSANVSAYRSLVSSLNAMITNDKAQLASLTTKLGTANATIATLKSQIALAVSVEANMSNIINLQYSKSLVSGQSVVIYGTTHTSSTPFETFSPVFAGFVLVTVTSSSEGYFLNYTSKPALQNGGGGVFDYYAFLAPSSSTSINYFIAPVTYGTASTFALLSPTATDGTATVDATYYY